MEGQRARSGTEVALTGIWRDGDCFTLVAAGQVVTDGPVYVILTGREGRVYRRNLQAFTVMTRNVVY